MNTPELSHLQWCEFIRDQVKHDDDLINQRVSWLNTSQAVFFSAYFLLSTREILASAGPHVRVMGLYFLPILGLLTSTFTYIGIVVLARSIMRQRNLFQEKCEQEHGKTPCYLPLMLDNRWKDYAVQAAPHNPICLYNCMVLRSAKHYHGAG
jgi:hypothetical protein